ncbi:2-oxo-4-hydroxy-4-carboxy-5-ureidoimidazoline decarboxylase [Psychrobacter sp.]|uniref:2-oxo-4-hydroxy-4-carboxy-5-ureidoimidazoline decarboxylase n=1 Tax=Psychrobacter sp. TaxID=56811 RepID=UPI0025CD4D47|nr:2-oxo-4-hydroxy-4-carboxy-5-ureidoimidazoline decarboxylase [Psychrobacter sp.]
MTIQLSNFNSLPHDEALYQLLICCTSKKWAETLLTNRPFASLDSLLQCSDEIWCHLSKSDYIEAFEGHPQIGDVSTLKEKYKNTLKSASKEQSLVNEADEDTLRALAKGNRDYLNKFGYIFIVFATGKSARQMLDILNTRLNNSDAKELIISAAEQNKITRHRLKNLITA